MDRLLVVTVEEDRVTHESELAPLACRQLSGLGRSCSLSSRRAHSSERARRPASKASEFLGLSEDVGDCYG